MTALRTPFALAAALGLAWALAVGCADVSGLASGSPSDGAPPEDGTTGNDAPGGSDAGVDSPAPPDAGPDTADGGPAPGSLVWAKHFGGPLDQYESAMALDPSGNAFIVGTLNGSADFGGGTLTSAGTADALLVKLDPNGGHLHSERWGDALDQFGVGVTTNGMGEAFFNVLFHGTLDLGTIGSYADNADGAFDLAVVRMRTDSTLASSVYLGGPGPQNGGAMAASPGQGVVVAAQNGGVVQVANKTLSAAGMNDAMFVHVLSTQDWAFPYSATSINAASVAYDPGGNVIFAGAFSGTLDVGGGAMNSGGGNDVFVAKFDATGKFIKGRSFPNPNDETATKVAVDATGIVILWQFTGTATFGGAASLTSNGAEDMFLLKLDTNLNTLTSVSFGGTGTETPNGLALDGSHDTLISGITFSPSLDFGGGAHVAGGGADVFVAKFDATGRHAWSHVFGDAGDQRSYGGVGVTSTGEVVLTGHFDGSIDLGAGPIATTDKHDLFLAKFRP